MTIFIVPMTPEHIEGFHATLDAVCRERKYLSFLEAPPLEQSRAFVLAGMARGNPHIVAMDGDQVVGWCDITRQERPVHAHTGTLGMGLSPAFRGLGHGRALIEAALPAAWRIGLIRVELGVYSHNVRAKTLYDRVGFVTEGVLCKAVLIDGTYSDITMMAILNAT